MNTMVTRFNSFVTNPEMALKTNFSSTNLLESQIFSATFKTGEHSLCVMFLLAITFS